MNIEIYILLGVAAVVVVALFKWVKELKNMAVSLDNLNLAVVSLTTAVDALIPVVSLPGVPEADVQLAADHINVQVARINAVLPVPAPAPPVP